MRLAERMDRIPPSGTIRMAELARKMEREGKKVLHLEVGEPDFDTPEHIKEAAYEAIRSGFTHYTSSRGILELREAVSEYMKTKGVDVDPEREILITPGTKHAIYCGCLAAINPGDEVLIMSPIWTTFYVCVRAAGGRPIEVKYGEGFTLEEETVKDLITGNTRMVILNSPNNPTGQVAKREALKLIADLAIDNDLLVLSDEIYDRFVYDGEKASSIASFDGMKERTLTVNGLSKTYAMTGWRLGYAVANEEWIEAMMRIQQNTTTCPPSFVQKAGVVALRGPQDCVDEMLRAYEKRRKLIFERLNRISGVKCQRPMGAFYVFPDFSSFGRDSSELVFGMLDSEGICATPGTAFGDCGKGHIRFSYATSLDVIEEAMNRLEEYVAEL